jgi:hypothetical protein
MLSSRIILVTGAAVCALYIGGFVADRQSAPTCRPFVLVERQDGVYDIQGRKLDYELHGWFVSATDEYVAHGEFEDSRACARGAS